MSKNERLMDPAVNDLIPNDDAPGPDPPELSPEFEERAAAEPRTAPALDAIAAALAASKADPCGFGGGLQLKRVEGGEGLHVFKDGLIVRDVLNLDAPELRTIKNYLEHAK